MHNLRALLNNILCLLLIILLLLINVLIIFIRLIIQIGKKKTKAFNTIKSPKENSTMKQSNIKFYKHVKLLSISSIKKVIDITETDGKPLLRMLFSLIYIFIIFIRY